MGEQYSSAEFVVFRKSRMPTAIAILNCHGIEDIASIHIN
jgi:hypothetical protein